MKKLLIKWFGAIWFCKMFHSRHGISPHYYYCNTCKLMTIKTPYSLDTSPR